jgi:DNA-binding SARP family transcriptional activator
VYEALSSTSEDDVPALAPPIPPAIRAEILDADPTLDVDVRDWFAKQCPRPRIGVLGPITVRCSGRLPERSPQQALHTEAAVFLALHPGGVPPHVFAQALWPHDPEAAGKSKVHAAITRLRKWLGRDLDTGAEYLPSNADDPWNATYVIENALVDAELFRRLRARGLARGESGIEDLDRALSLVTGPPFHDAPAPRATGPGGYGWLTEGNTRLDNEYLSMIVDTAHTVATHYLAAGMAQRAAEAAHIARLTGSYDDIPLLDLVKASLDLGKDAEADAWIQQILTNNDADVEEDLPPRTAEIIFRLQRHWRHRTSATG